MKRILLLLIVIFSFSCKEEIEETQILTIAMVKDSNAILNSFVHSGFYENFQDLSHLGSGDLEQVVSYEFKGTDPLVFTLWNTSGYAKVAISFAVLGRETITFTRHFDKMDMIHHMIYENGDKEAARELYDGIKNMPNVYAYRVNF